MGRSSTPSSNSDNGSRLARRLNTGDAVFIGLGSMIGAGIFSAAAPAVKVAGSGVLIAVLFAGGLAFLNAISVAQLASIFPESGGTYVYGKKLLGPLSGFLAGWGFIIGKVASCTAMALTFAYYFSPSFARPLAVSAVLILTFVNYWGIKKTALATKAIVSFVLLSLFIVVIATLLGGNPNPEKIEGIFDGGVLGILGATGIMFFAFAGYARIATLGEEVIHPSKTIPKAILISLSITIAIYFIVVASVLLCVDLNELRDTDTPFVVAVQSGKYSFLSPLVRIGACVASLGVLLSLLAGVSRTIFAMAAQKDLPKFLSAIHSENKVPHRAEIAVGLLVALIASLTDIRSAIGFSSFAILVYYAIANLAAWYLPISVRQWPRWTSLLGFGACITIAFSLPLSSILGGLILFLIGAIYYKLK